MKKVMYLITFIFPILLFAAQRKPLVEVYTATWCSYCPYSSYGLDTLEMNYPDSFTVIKYHPSSADSFNTIEAVNRANYYPDLTGYPTAYFDGTTQIVGGWNGVYSAYKNALLQRLDSISPATIYLNVDYNSVHRTGLCYIQVHAEQKLPDDTRLRIAIVEDSIFFNWQSRDVLRYVLRRMLPDANGIQVNLGSGEELEDTINFSLDNDWIEPYVYIVAFLQDDNTREILQSNAMRIPVDYGKLEIPSFSYDDSICNNNNRLETQDSAVFNFKITAVKPYNTAKWVNINFTSNDPYIEIDSSSFYMDSIPVGDTVTISTIVHSTGGNTRMVNFFIKLASDSGRSFKEDTFNIKVGFDSLLVWDGTWSATLKDYVLPYLDELGVKYDFQSEQDSGKPQIYTAYKHVFYYSGNTTSDSSAISLLETTMDSGKNVFITGQNIARSRDSLFLNNYLKVKYLYDTTMDLLVVGTGNLFTPEDTVFLTSQGSAMNQYSKDVIEPISNAFPILYYRKYNQPDSDTVAAVAYNDGTKKVVFFAFGYEGMGTPKTGKKEVLRRILNYFGYSISGVKEAPEKYRLNGTNTIILHSSIIKKGVSFNGKQYFIFTPTGRVTYTGKIKSNSISFPDRIKNGIYFVKIGNSNTKIIRVLLMR